MSRQRNTTFGRLFIGTIDIALQSAEKVVIAIDTTGGREGRFRDVGAGVADAGAGSAAFMGLRAGETAGADFVAGTCVFGRCTVADVA